MLVATKRIIKAGFINFWRNSFISLSAILIMVITLFVIGSLIFVNQMLSSSLEQIRDKIDVNVYFITTASESGILEVKKTLELRGDVERVTYISRDQALADFRKRHANDSVSLQALEELDDNPLRASLRIKAKDPSQYTDIATFLEQGVTTRAADGSPIIARINFNENRVVIERLARIIDSLESFGLILTITLVVASVLITFNTIRLAIFTAREEISVMRLVGASHSYIRGPFVFEGVMYGTIAAIITLVAFYPLTMWLGPITESFFGDVNVFTYYIAEFPRIFGIIMSSGMLLGMISSYLAVRRFLRL